MIENVSRNNHCSYCLDDGVVLACTRPATVEGEFYEEMAPCPRCEKGRFLEYPPAERPKSPKTPPCKPAFPHGYWQGRAFDGEPQGLGKPLPVEEAKAKVLELTERVAKAIAENPIYKRKRLALEARSTGRARLATSEKAFENPEDAASPGGPQ